ncbi:MAG TPA: ABC transporter ATP-binding protein, partial [Actinomycetota bacterium]|nr:ABC transporter ATP-binding protein [Actinomycetota bacterium]
MGEAGVHDGKRDGNRRATRRLLIATARNGRWWVGVMVGAALVMAAADVALPAVLGRGVDSIIHRAPRSWILASALCVAAFVAADALDDWASGAATAVSTAWLRRSVLTRFLSLGLSANRFASGDLSTRMTGNAADAGRVGAGLVRGVANVATGAGAAVALALIDPWLALAFVAGMPILALVLRTFARQISVTAEAYLGAQGAITARLLDAVSGARTIAAAGTLDREVARVLQPLPELRAHGLAMWRQHGRFGSLDALLSPMLGVVVLAAAGAELARGRITPGEMLAASQYAMLGTALTSLAAVVRTLAQARAGGSRVGEIFGTKAQVYGEAALPDGGGRIGFQGVTIRSGGRAALDGVDLDIPAGACVAVVGKSGSGKSTLAAAAGRLVDPDEGEVTLDGVALPRLRKEALRSAFTYAFERPHLCGETLGDAIAFGQAGPPPEAVVAAGRAAAADTFIRRMPDGYATPLARAPMSGGEIQRISLARAFAHAGRVLIFDDVAASLDTVTEHEIAGVLDTQYADRTRIVVAHRASTAARADLVVWLEEGRLRAVAAHQLLWDEPAYRALFGSDGQPTGAGPRPCGPGEPRPGGPGARPGGPGEPR